MKYLGLIIAVVIAVAAAFFVLQMSSESPSQPAPMRQVEVSGQQQKAIQEVNIYVAARDIPVGTVIDANMLTTRPWPQHLVVDGFVVGSQAGQDIVNTVARASFKRNEPINRSKLVNPDDPNFLAGELPKGMRLTTIQVDEISAVAGFVFPGDRVDVLVTHEILRDGFTEEDLLDSRRGEITEEVTETILQDVRVLAVDQRASAGVGDNGQVIVPGSISLEVSLEDAQRLKLAEEMGRLALALRSVEDKDSVQQIPLTRPKDLTQYSMTGDEKSDVAGKNPIKVIRGTQMELLEN